MQNSSLLVALFLAAFAAPVARGQAQPAPLSSNAKLRIRSIVSNRSAVACFGLYQLTLGIDATFDNPFDPDDVDVWADMKSPTGRQLRVNAYYDQPFTRKLENGKEVIEPAGDARWMLRFTPGEAGEWRYRLMAKDRSGTTGGPEAAFSVMPSAAAGFIVRSPKAPGLFARSVGTAFVPVGVNMGWGGARGTYDFDDWLPAFGKGGGSLIRLWMCSWNCALEWSAENRGDWRAGAYHGVGVYSLDNAWKLDQILDRAAANGVAVMLCLGTFGEFTEGGYFNEGQWKANPYNAANGGPCKTPDEFWTNETARKLYRRRLRYLAARYGWRTNVQSWEFWNEVPPRPEWLAEMARYLKGAGEFAGAPADPHGHLVSTSYGNEAVWKTPEIDFTMSHHYGTGDRPDHAPIIADDADAHAALGKPHLMAEFGIDYRKPDGEYDPKGINLHNGLWASLAAGNAGTAMLWWWDNYLHPKGLWQAFAPVRQFVDAVPWGEGAWKPARIDEPRGDAGSEALHEMVYPASGGWDKASATEYTLDPGGVRGGLGLPGFLFSPGKADMRTTPEFHVDFKKGGRFVLRVSSVCQKARLRFELDGALAKDILFDPSPVKPGEQAEYKSTELLKQYNVYQALYEKDYGIDIPAGRHVVKLDVAEGDWLSLESIALTNYRSSPFPQLDVRGRTNGKAAFVWVHNPKHNWKRVLAGEAIAPVAGATYALRDLPDGAYSVAWWDTWKGGEPRREWIVCRAGELKLALPPVATDIAVIVAPEAPKPAGDAKAKAPGAPTGAGAAKPQPAKAPAGREGKKSGR